MIGLLTGHLAQDDVLSSLGGVTLLTIDRSGKRGYKCLFHDLEVFMSIDHEKLRALADSLTDDQRQLLREGLSSGEAPNADQLSVALQSFDIEAVNALSSAPAPSDAMVADAGAGDAGAGDAGADAGTSTVRPEPPLTRW